MDEENGGSSSLSKTLSRVLLVGVVLAALYAGWMFFSRWNAARQLRKASQAAEIERARKDVELNGGDALKVLTIYAIPGTVHRGEAAQLCYGVANAAKVEFTPPVENVWPSHSRCVEVRPRQRTDYVLTATDAAGHTQKADIVIDVK